MLLALVGLGWRVAYWQFERQAMLSAWADDEHLRALQVPAGRGEILDANGVILALSVTEDSVVADPEVLDATGTLDRTASLTGLPAQTVRSQFDVPGQYAQLRGRDGLPLLLTAEQSAMLALLVESGSLPGIALIPQVQRVYPSGALAAQVLGFVRASDGSGQYGIEGGYDTALAGQPGILYTAVDVQGRPLATVRQRQASPVPGANVTLTIDANVQYWAEQGLARTLKQMDADGGTVIVLDPKTGAIVAMASEPSFDPNAYADAPLADLSNLAVSAVYDPGSVMKAITMATGIEQGVITPQTTVYDSGSTVVDGVTIYNFDQQGHGLETMTQVLKYSANVGAIWVAQRVGRDSFERSLEAFGFGSAAGVGLPAEASGLMAQPSSPGEAELALAENSFGESIAVTPLQMAAAYGALANGGVLMRPYIVASVAHDGGKGAGTSYGPHAVRRVVSAQTAKTVTSMLVDSALQSEAEMNQVDGYSVAAKTGTSTPDPNNPSWTYASVLGYAPATNPRFVLLVKLDHPQATIFGGETAGPLWRELAERMFAYYHIPPDKAA